MILETNTSKRNTVGNEMAAVISRNVPSVVVLEMNHSANVPSLLWAIFRYGQNAI